MSNRENSIARSIVYWFRFGQTNHVWGVYALSREKEEGRPYRPDSTTLRIDCMLMGELRDSYDFESMAASENPEFVAMEQSVRLRVLPILTDLYQFTMAYSYWRSGRHNEHAVFELFFRDNPFSGGFSLFAGLTDCLLFLRNFRFSEEGRESARAKLVNYAPK